jgi:APA family basic amino acid/polyamine antiporter
MHVAALARSMRLLDRLIRRKPIDRFGTGHSALQRSIGLFQLVMFGVGGTIGTGIFFVLTQQVPVAGPAVILSFMIAGFAAGLTALCYAEMSSTIPIAGSSYSYTYATLGEAPAFFVAACLVLEYGVSGAAVAVGWSEYVAKLVADLTGLTLPYALTHAPIVADPANVYALRFGGPGAGLINLPAVVLISLCTLLLMRGSRESVLANTLMVMTKLAVLTLFIVVAGGAFQAHNLTPFAPHGLAGVGAAAGSIFFTFVGLDSVSTAGEEVVNPRRNLPLAILIALAVVLTFYALVAVAALGSQPASAFAGQEAGLAVILQHVTGAKWPADILAAGAVVSIFSVTLVCLFGQSRILFAVSRDGLLPGFFHKIAARTHVPFGSVASVGVAVAVIAAFTPSEVLWDLTSMGTLAAFSVVSLGVIILRRTQPTATRGFRTPFFPLVPVLSVISCLYLIFQLRPLVFEVTGVWLAVAGAIYLGYSARNSGLETAET